MQASSNRRTILGLDIGSKRIGIARVHLDALLPAPLTTLQNPETFLDDIVKLAEQEQAAFVVCGLPRGMQGQSTDQTVWVEDFGRRLAHRLEIPLYWTDEALTSQKAEEELDRRGKPYAKGDVDALAATIILEDYIKEHPDLHG